MSWTMREPSSRRAECAAPSPPSRLQHVVVDVAVADVAEGDDAARRRRRPRIAAVGLAPGSRRCARPAPRRRASRSRPRASGPATGSRAAPRAPWPGRRLWAIAASRDQAGLQRRGQDALHGRLRRARLARGDLDQHVPGVTVSPAGSRVPAMLLQRELHAPPAHQLEGLHRPAGLVLGAGQQLDRGVRASPAPTMATAREARIGNSFRLAAVTTPSVPSAPISSCFRS